DRVVPGAVEPAPRWLHGDVVFVSTEDVADPDGLEQWLERVSLVVLSRGRDDCTVWDRHGRHVIPPLPAREGDPTGAGDAFAAAFLIRYAETGDARQSALFASAAGAIAVEAAGFDALGTRDQIEVRMATAGARA